MNTVALLKRARAAVRNGSSAHAAVGTITRSLSEADTNKFCVAVSFGVPEEHAKRPHLWAYVSYATSKDITKSDVIKMFDRAIAAQGEA